MILLVEFFSCWWSKMLAREIPIFSFLYPRRRLGSWRPSTKRGMWDLGLNLSQFIWCPLAGRAELFAYHVFTVQVFLLTYLAFYTNIYLLYDKKKFLFSYKLGKMVHNLYPVIIYFFLLINYYFLSVGNF